MARQLPLSLAPPRRYTATHQMDLACASRVRKHWAWPRSHTCSIAAHRHGGRPRSADLERLVYAAADCVRPGAPRPGGYVKDANGCDVVGVPLEHKHAASGRHVPHAQCPVPAAAARSPT
eukprot:scaffold7246_cov410-Prasinococcus_capsulatus_cf.AAC.3